MALAEKELYLKIGRPHNACVACGAEIAHAGKHPSVLRRASAPTEQPQGDSLPLDPDAPRRDDYCAECWQKVENSDHLGFWLTKREPPKQRKIESKKERNAGMIAWFEHLQSLPQEQDTREALYFLSHLLMKYGVFKWQRTEQLENGNEKIFFRQTGSEEDIIIESIDLTDERSAEIKRDLDAFLLQFANAQPETESPESEEQSDSAPAGE